MGGSGRGKPYSLEIARGEPLHQQEIVRLALLQVALLQVALGSLGPGAGLRACMSNRLSRVTATGWELCFGNSS